MYTHYTLYNTKYTVHPSCLRRQSKSARMVYLHLNTINSFFAFQEKKDNKQYKSNNEKGELKTKLEELDLV